MKQYGLLDCNNFFVSCERLFRPDLEHKPVIVLSSNDGCVISRSEEAKQLGIQMGVPFFQIEEACRKENISVFSSNFTLYRDLSQRVFLTLASYVDDMEMYSIDEAFFAYDPEVSDIDLISVRAEIVRRVGIPVSIGVSTTKTMAKLASKKAKKSNGGVFHLTQQTLTELYGDEGVGVLWGVGRKLREHLGKIGITTISDLITAETRVLREALGVIGERLQYEVQGIPAYVRSYDTTKTLTSTRSFGVPQTDKDVLRSAIAYHVSSLGEKLRSQGLCAQYVSIVCAPGRYSNFYIDKPYRACTILPTQDTRVLMRTARSLLDSLYESGIPYGKAGVILGGLTPAGLQSRSLFSTKDEEESSETLNALMDTINAQNGKNVLQFATVALSEKWKSKATHISPRYTTQWSEIPFVRIG